MRSLRSFGVVVMSLLLWGCVSLPSQKAGRWKVTLQRFACLGTCPVYTVSIDDQGRVVYRGQQFVAVVGDRSDTVSREVAQWLRQQLEQLGVWDLAEGWHHRPPVADVPAVALTIEEEDSSRTIRFLEFQTPAFLHRAAALVDSIANVHRWIWQGGDGK